MLMKLTPDGAIFRQKGDKIGLLEIFKGWKSPILGNKKDDFGL